MAFDFSNPVVPSNSSQNWFMITYNGVPYQMNVTTDVVVEESSKITDHKAQDTTVITDNTVAYNRKIRYNGIISSVRRLDQNSYLEPAVFLERLSQIRKTKGIVSCELDGEVEAIDNCLIEKISYSKGKSEGLTSWLVNISLKEIRLSDQVSRTTVPSPSLNGSTDATTPVGNSPTRAKALTGVIGI